MRFFFSAGKPVEREADEDDFFIGILVTGLVKAGDAGVGQHGQAGIGGWAGVKHLREGDSAVGAGCVRNAGQDAGEQEDAHQL